MTIRRAARAVGLAIALGASSVLAVAQPAAAHSTGGLTPSNYKTVVRGISPAAPGVTVTTSDLGTRLRLTNHSRHEVTVLGYENEPYLKIGPRGVFVNMRSPAVYLNKSTIPSTSATVPQGYDAAAAPKWVQLSSTPAYRWHDHRAHWMGNGPPPAVQRNPGRSHTVIEGWKVPLRVDGAPATITGDVVWVPGPSPWIWLLVAVALAAVVYFAGMTSAFRWVAVAALVALLFAVAIDLGGSWGGSTASAGSKVGASVYTGVAWIMGVSALVWMLLPSWRRAVPAVMFTGIVFVIVSGLGNITALWKSQVPSSAGPDWARVAVVIALGVGTGLTILAARHLKPVGADIVAGPPARRRKLAQSAAR